MLTDEAYTIKRFVHHIMLFLLWLSRVYISTNLKAALVSEDQSASTYVEVYQLSIASDCSHFRFFFPSSRKALRSNIKLSLWASFRQVSVGDIGGGGGGGGGCGTYRSNM